MGIRTWKRPDENLNRRDTEVHREKRSPLILGASSVVKFFGSCKDHTRTV